MIGRSRVPRPPDRIRPLRSVMYLKTLSGAPILARVHLLRRSLLPLHGGWSLARRRLRWRRRTRHVGPETPPPASARTARCPPSRPVTRSCSPSSTDLDSGQLADALAFVNKVEPSDRDLKAELHQQPRGGLRARPHVREGHQAVAGQDRRGRPDQPDRGRPHRRLRDPDRRRGQGRGVPEGRRSRLRLQARDLQRRQLHRRRRRQRPGRGR